jgi:hypothetical protein
MVRFHGNYCGPNWSAGKAQASVVSDVVAVDEFDQTCKEHDAAYAIGANLRQADLKFARQNFLKGVKPTIASILVGAQGLARSHDKPQPTSKTLSTSKISNLNRPRSPPRTIQDMSKASSKSSKLAPLQVSNKMKNIRLNAALGKTQKVSRQLTAAPVSFSQRVTMPKPKMSTVNGDAVIKHREYVGTVSGSTTFNCSSYPINPGLNSVFPWLNSIAANYDKYRFRSLKFDYVPAVSSATVGRITLAFNYNAGDSIPVSKQQIFSVAPNEEQAVWCPLSMNVPTISETLYTREYLVQGQDIKTFDIGQLLLATDLCAGSGIIGELYVEYEIAFQKPHPQSLTTSEIYNISTTSVTNIFPSTGGTVYIPPGSWGQSTAANSLQCNLAGRWLICIELSGTVCSDVTLSATSGTITAVSSGAVRIGNPAATKTMSIGVYDIVLDSFIKTATILLTPTATTVNHVMFWASQLDSNTNYSTAM